MTDAVTPDAVTPETEKLDINVTVEDSGPSRKKIAVEIPAAVVDEKIGESLDTILEEAELPGFRKGRAPKRLVEKKFGSTVRAEATRQLIGMAYSQAIEDNDLKVIGNPEGDDLDKLEAEAGTPLSFTVEVEVQPEFEMPEIEGIKIKRPAFEIKDEHVDGEVQKIAINEGELEERDDAEPGDYISGHGIMTGPDGEEFYNIEGAVVRVPLESDEGRGMILGVAVSDFDAQLGRPKKDETATIKVVGPEHHEREELRGKDLTITFKVDRIDRIIPASVEDVVQRYGMESEAQLKEAVSTRLRQRAIIQQHTLMRQQIAKHLLDNTEMVLPERLTAGQAERILERRRMELLYRGVDQAEIEQHMAELRAGSTQLAQRELKLFFILNHAANDMGVRVEESEINGRIAQMAVERGMRPEELKRQLIEQRQISYLATQIREHKAMDAILNKALIEDVKGEAEMAALEAEAAEAEATAEG